MIRCEHTRVCSRACVSVSGECAIECVCECARVWEGARVRAFERVVGLVPVGTAQQECLLSA